MVGYDILRETPAEVSLITSCTPIPAPNSPGSLPDDITASYMGNSLAPTVSHVRAAITTGRMRELRISTGMWVIILPSL
jgi:hypothetical protein